MASVASYRPLLIAAVREYVIFVFVVFHFLLLALLLKMLAPPDRYLVVDSIQAPLFTEGLTDYQTKHFRHVASCVGI